MASSAPYYLMATLFFSLFSDSAWAVKLFHKTITPNASYAIVTFFIRIGWASIGLQHQYLALFIQKLIKKNAPLGVVQTVLTGIAYIFLFYFAYCAFFSISLTTKESQLLAQTILYNPPLEVAMVRMVTLYLAIVLIVPVAFIILHHARASTLPKIVRKQLRIFIFCFLCPYLAIELLQGLAITFSILEQNLYIIVGLATLLLIITMNYALKHLLMLRFMNWTDQIVSLGYKKNPTLFKNILEQLSHAHTIHELQYITEHFFISSFSLATGKVLLHFPQENHPAEHLKTPSIIIDSLINANREIGTDHIQQLPIIVYDDIAFNNFHTSSQLNKELLNSLDILDADVFLPLYRNNYMSASIIIKKNARSSHTFYSKIEQDAMLMFAHYLSSSINLVHTNKTNTLIKRTHHMHEKIYRANQEIALFKESLRPFIPAHQQQKCGLLFYHNNLFITGNHYASELLPLSLNHQKGHPLVKKITKMSHTSMLSQIPQTLLYHSPHDKQLIAVSGSMQLNRKSALITLHHASIPQVLQAHDHMLYNPADWHYLFFLQTTMIGIQLNSYIPSMREYTLNLKINILKALLKPHGLLINAHEDDSADIISFLKQLYTTKTIHVIPIEHKEKTPQSAHLIFGNRLSKHTTRQRHNLLEKGEKDALIVIKNIQFMHSDGQQKLAAFIESGIYTPFNDDEEKKQSNAHIIVTISGSVQQMLNTGMLDKKLYQCIKNNKLTIPSVATWPIDECLFLIEGIIEKILTLNPLHHLATITDKNKRALYYAAPESMQALHKKIHAIIHNKATSNSSKSATLNDTLTETDRENLMLIAQLGKKALKDSDKMRLLWQAFHSQHAIARFLGVHASTVHIQCKKQGLE